MEPVDTNETAASHFSLTAKTNTRSVATIRNYKVPGQPAIAGERVLLYATGIDRLANLSAQIGDERVATAAISPVPGHVGLFEVAVFLPERAVKNGDLPLLLSGNTTEGVVALSNVLNLAVEAK